MGDKDNRKLSLAELEESMSYEWIDDRLPTEEDADADGLVRWIQSRPGLMIDWQSVRLGEQWSRTSSWQPPQQ